MSTGAEAYRARAGLPQEPPACCGGILLLLLQLLLGKRALLDVPTTCASGATCRTSATALLRSRPRAPIFIVHRSVNLVQRLSIFGGDAPYADRHIDWIVIVRKSTYRCVQLFPASAMAILAIAQNGDY